MKVTKTHIIDSLHEQNGFSKEEAARVLDSLFEIVKKTLEGGEDVLISRFGRFCVKDKRKRAGRNPRSGEPMDLDARRIVTFKCSRVLRDRINRDLKAY